MDISDEELDKLVEEVCENKVPNLARLEIITNAAENPEHVALFTQITKEIDQRTSEAINKSREMRIETPIVRSEEIDARNLENVDQQLEILKEDEDLGDELEINPNSKLYKNIAQTTNPSAKKLFLP